MAGLETHKELWLTLRDEFGPKRLETKAYPEVHQANAFVGNYLRLELLSRFGRCRQLKQELLDYFLYTAEKTGTLWEHRRSSASCNHGFASHVAHFLYRDVLGLYRVDTQKKVVELRFSDVGLDFCQGTMPTAEGVVSLWWRTEGDKILYRASVPAGFLLKVTNLTGRRLTLAP